MTLYMGRGNSNFVFLFNTKLQQQKVYEKKVIEKKNADREPYRLAHRDIKIFH